MSPWGVPADRSNHRPRCGFGLQPLRAGTTLAGHGLVPASCHVVGYAPAFSGGNSMLDLTNQDRTILDEVNSQAGYPAGSLIPPTDRVLFADATINQNLDGSGSWNDMVGGLPTAKILHRSTPYNFQTGSNFPP